MCFTPRTHALHRPPPLEMELPEKVFVAFSDALAALYAAPDRDRRIASLLARLHEVFATCCITIQSKATAPSRLAPRANVLMVPIEGTPLHIRLQRERGFTEQEHFLAQQLRAHLAVAFAEAMPVPQPLEGPRPDPRPADLRGLGLTARECEVLHWITLGKRDSEIAGIIRAAPRTVNKHVENIFAKLGVETRLAAARHAADWLAQSRRRS